MEPLVQPLRIVRRGDEKDVIDLETLMAPGVRILRQAVFSYRESLLLCRKKHWLRTGEWPLGRALAMIGSQ